MVAVVDGISSLNCTFRPPGATLFCRYITTTIAEIEGHNVSTWSLDFSPDGTLIAAACIDRTIRIWNAHDGSKQMEIEGYRHFVRRV